MTTLAIMNKDDALKDLCRALLVDPEVTALPDWRKVVMVGIVDGGSARMHGYCFNDTGDWEAAAPQRRGTLDVLRGLQAAMKESDPQGRAWVSCLLRFSSEGQVGIDFEYDDAARWSVTPANRSVRVDEFRAMPIRDGGH